MSPVQPLVTLEAARKAYGPRVLLDGVSLGVAAGDRIGVVGRNGAGKTTLLEALAGRAHLDSGRASRMRDLTLGYLPQAEELSGTVCEDRLATENCVSFSGNEHNRFRYVVLFFDDHRARPKVHPSYEARHL